MGREGGGAQAVGCCSNPGPWLSPQRVRSPRRLEELSPGKRRSDGSAGSQSPGRWGSLAGLSAEGLEAPCPQDQKPQVESGLEALVAAPAVVAGTCCPLVAVWLVSTAGRGQELGSFVSSSELPGAERVWLRGTRIASHKA